MPWMKGYPYYLLLGGAISLYMGATSCRFRKLPGRRYVWILLLLIGFALIATAAEIMTPVFEVKLWLRNVQQLPLFFIPLTAYAAVREYVSPPRSGFLRRLSLLSLPLFVDIALIFTDPYHHLMRSGVGVETVAGISGISVQPTLLSMILIAYDQVFSLYAALLLAASLKGTPRDKLKLNVLLLLGMLVPVVSTFALPALNITFPGFTALTLLPSVVAMYFTIYWHPRLSLVPSITDRLLGSAKQGMVLIDRHDAILSVNESGERLLSSIFGPVPGSWLGRGIRPVLSPYPYIHDCYLERKGGQIQLELAEKGDFCCGVSLIPLDGSSGEAEMLMILTDYSDKKRYERELEYQASIDDLTGLYNRRHFLNAFRSWNNKEEEGRAMLLMDIDDFKRINDTYGHLAGDQALVSFSRKVRNLCKGGAIAGRLGGEEFALCLYAQGEAAALEIAEGIRRAIAPHTVMLDEGRSIELTVSIGMVYTDDPDIPFEELYRQADEALYVSKTNGKNKVTMGGQSSVS